TYTVSTNVPYINPTDKDKSFWAYDKLTGAEYVNTDQATITLNGEDVTESYPISFDSVNNKFSVDLSAMINDANSHAGEQVVITYQVK
ncbi:isopeptide-forming domain-containing fimbrial protein, partial [Salmonella enterica]|uniref:isopeptide-forming domain-containing fimbrial protein n=2 Tax=Bacteria TaxID=2 RepID=UPI003CF5CFB1